MIKTVLRSLSPRLVLLGLIMIISSGAYAQFDEGSGEVPPDSAVAEESYDTGVVVVEEEKKAPEFLPYVRIQLPVDTVTELIAYKGIVDFGNCEFCMTDSLYIRAKRYLLKKYGEGKKEMPKEMILKDQAPEKYFINVKVPLHLVSKGAADVVSGWYSFKLELRFSEPKYKYIVTSFVHYYTVFDGKKDVEKFNYAEYYQQSKKNIKGGDQFLRAIDADIKKMLTELNKALKDPKPLYVDEDDWE